MPWRDLRGTRFIFVCGAYNSGTTLVADYIRRTLGLSGLTTEGDSLVDFLLTPEKIGFSRFPTACRHELEKNSGELNSDHALQCRRIWAAASSPFSNREVFVEKSICNALRLHWLQDNFPDADFIWVQRNPYCVSEGILRRSRKNTTLKSVPDVETAFLQWKYLTENLSEFFLPKYAGNIIRYEDFVEAPDVQVKRVLGHRGGGVTPRHRATYSFSFHGESRKISNDDPQSLSRLSQADIIRLNSKFGPEIAQFGYDVVS